MPSRCVIHWFRRDLRIRDNTALLAASQEAETVIPIYIVSDWKGDHAWTGAGRQAFLCGCLSSLSRNLETRKGRLIVRRGEAVEVLASLVEETGADAVYFNRDPDPFGRAAETRLEEAGSRLGFSVHGHLDVVLHEPDAVLTQSGTPYRVYSPYARAWFDQSKSQPAGLPKPLHTPERVASDPLPSLATWDLEEANLTPFAAGERAARQRLKEAVDHRLDHYAENRNLPADEGGSRLGPDLRYGTVSIREVWARTRAAAEQARHHATRSSLQTFQRQLAWREFFMSILHHRPEVLDHPFDRGWDGLEWDDPDDSDHLARWKAGQTGFPMVDAGMRQLLATGYMHNRVRMITAMFLTKDLHLHWKHGERHFLQHLLDGEIANNNGGWQWSAGTGADAAPYFRIQNPWTQTARYDADGAYIRRWVPELSKVEARQFHKAPKDDRPIADDYPLPMLDHGEERSRALDRFKACREQATTR